MHVIAAMFFQIEPKTSVCLQRSFSVNWDRTLPHASLWTYKNPDNRTDGQAALQGEAVGSGARKGWRPQRGALAGAPGG